MWQADVAAGTTGDVVVVWNTGQSRCGVGIFAVYGAAAAANDTAGSVTDPLTAGGLDILAGGVAIGGGYNGNTSAFTWTGLTEDYDELVSGAQYHSGASDAFQAAETARTVTADVTGTPSGQCGVFASWGPA